MTVTQVVPGRERTITTADDAKFLILSARPEHGPRTWNGTWVLEFTPTLDFDGNIAVMGRPDGRPYTNTSIAFVPIHYTAEFLNGVADDNSTMRTTVISGESLINVSAMDKQIALLVSCTAGSVVVSSNGAVSVTNP